MAKHRPFISAFLTFEASQQQGNSQTENKNSQLWNGSTMQMTN